MIVKYKNITHWYLQHSSGLIIDPTVIQFAIKPDYLKGKGCGFLTKQPSRRAFELMDKMVWQ